MPAWPTWPQRRGCVQPDRWALQAPQDQLALRALPVNRDQMDCSRGQEHLALPAHLEILERLAFPDIQVNLESMERRESKYFLALDLQDHLETQGHPADLATMELHRLAYPVQQVLKALAEGMVVPALWDHQEQLVRREVQELMPGTVPARNDLRRVMLWLLLSPKPTKAFTLLICLLPVAGKPDFSYKGEQSSLPAAGKANFEYKGAEGKLPAEGKPRFEYKGHQGKLPAEGKPNFEYRGHEGNLPADAKPNFEYKAHQSSLPAEAKPTFEYNAHAASLPVRPEKPPAPYENVHPASLPTKPEKEDSGYVNVASASLSVKSSRVV
ncbi:hypothetical protein QR680_015867 [Steinernema hermaphroditum]|uniref:Uncharacterized protein n=1 Tax=Steinernema hermaphroditum TaxID=289476 RepID=A0AA39HAA1_9BILA|nr:hypothetical protein QR680_015867 [Steinernema hermaphroditum]